MTNYSMVVVQKIFTTLSQDKQKLITKNVQFCEILTTKYGHVTYCLLTTRPCTVGSVIRVCTCGMYEKTREVVTYILYCLFHYIFYSVHPRLVEGI